MRNALAIARKELGIYFTTPWAYVVFAAMTALTSFFFLAWLQRFKDVQEIAKGVPWKNLPPDWGMFKNLTDGVILPTWGMVVVITMFVAPFLSMRLLAEEKRQKTFELLMTVPVRPGEIVLGKYLGGLGVITATLATTIVFPLILSTIGTGESGNALEWPTVLLGYGALLLWGATCMAVGLFLSSITESQMLAAFLTFALLLPWWLLRGVGMSAEEPLRSIIKHLAFSTQLENLMQGVLDLKAVVFFISVILFSIFLTHRSVEAHRWT